MPTAFFFLLLFAFNMPMQADAAEPIRIGGTLGLTGKYSATSIPRLRAFKLWERDVNRKGGILNRKVQVVIYDDKSDPETAVSLYKRLIQEEKVDLLFAPYSTAITEAVLPVTEKHGYPMLISGAGADKLWHKGYRYIFGIFAPASKFVVGFLEMAVMNDLGKIAIVHADDPFSVNIAKSTKTWAERFGMKVLLYEKFKKGTRDLDFLAEKARSSGADILVMCGHFNEAVDMSLSLKRTGWRPRAYFATVGPGLQAFYDRLGADAEYVFSHSQWEPHERLPFPGSERFTREYMKEYKVMPSFHAATAYAAGQILEAAVRKAGSLDREMIRNILSVMDTMSIIGRYGVDRTGMQTKHFILTIQWQRGRKEVVWPEKLSTARPIFR